MTTTTTTTLVAYHGDATLKDRFLAELKAHADADAIVQGTYGEFVQGTYGEIDESRWKGCAVGCSIHSMAKITARNLDTSNHSLYESLLGIPEWLAHLEDTIFEGLSVWEARPWPIRFAEAIPVGADLESARHQFLEWLMERNLETVRGLPLDNPLRPQVIGAIVTVRNMHTAQLPASDPRWVAARRAAAKAAKAAADAVQTATVWVSAAAWAATVASSWAAPAQAAETSEAAQASKAAVAMAAVATAAAETTAAWRSAEGEAEAEAWASFADQLITILSEAGPGEGVR